MNNIIITTTNSIENAVIEKYMGVITTNLVVGTNVFSDFAASFTDFFGGISDTYQRKLQLIYKEAMSDLSAKAMVIGANCILGLHVDFDEISGKGKSMFMISVMGTAVKVQCPVEVERTEASDMISFEELNAECLKRLYLEKFETELPSEEEWEYISSHDMPELAFVLYRGFIKARGASTESEGHKLIKQNFPLYLNKLDYRQAVEVAYSDITTFPAVTIKLISDLRLFNAERIHQILRDGKITFAANLLAANKATYTKEDLGAMKRLIEAFKSLPDLGSIEVVKGGLLSKAGEKYICPNGHKNSADVEFCQEINCGLNIKGLSQKVCEKIDAFARKVNVLEQMLQ